nr:antitoxin protein [uncultured bacterium]
MAANQLVQTRIDGAIKEEAAAVLAAMGLTVSDAVRLLLTKVAQDKALPFEPLIPNATTIEAMKEARKGKLPRFATVNDLMADLHGVVSENGKNRTLRERSAFREGATR